MSEKAKEEFYSRPVKLGKWESCSQFLYNGETGQIFGRTCGSWAKLIFFYLCFYSVLSAFFAALLTLFYQTIDETKPKWTLEGSLIGANPGLGFRPMPEDAHIESTLIWYKGSDETNYKTWTNQIDRFLATYMDPAQQTENDVKQLCDYDRTPRDGKTCIVDMNSFGPCTSDNSYNYQKHAPCIFLKLNKIFGWIPDIYNETKEDDRNALKLPDNMPTELKKHIASERKRNLRSTNTIWVSCEGENPADVENIGPIQYYPKRGFQGFFFPYLNQKGYSSPVVAVFFERPKQGVLINIECKAWAKNIHHDRADRRGSVHFELMVD